jgi:hypothetical protein
VDDDECRALSRDSPMRVPDGHRRARSIRNLALLVLAACQPSFPTTLAVDDLPATRPYVVLDGVLRAEGAGPPVHTHALGPIHMQGDKACRDTLGEPRCGTGWIACTTDKVHFEVEYFRVECNGPPPPPR